MNKEQNDWNEYALKMRRRHARAGYIWSGFLVAAIIVAMLVHFLIWDARYTECRAHGFSAFYCWTSR